MSQDNHKAGGSTQSETEKLKRKIQLLEEKNFQLEQQATEQEPVQKRTKIFEDWKIENESHLKSAKRRLKYHVREKNPKQILETIKKIVVEAETDLSPEIKELMMEISGQAWPGQVTSCLDYNTGHRVLKLDGA